MPLFIFISRCLTRFSFWLYTPVRKLERFTNKVDNTYRFHKKYGRGDKCMIKDCECKK